MTSPKPHSRKMNLLTAKKTVQRPWAKGRRLTMRSLEGGNESLKQNVGSRCRMKGTDTRYPGREGQQHLAAPWKGVLRE